MNDNLIDQEEWRWLLAGGTYIPEKMDNAATEWLSERSWNDLMMLAALVK